MNTNFDFRRNAIPTQEDKARLREELEQQMAEYKGEITVLPSVVLHGTAEHHVHLSESIDSQFMSMNRKLRLWLDQNKSQSKRLAKLAGIKHSQLINKANGYNQITSEEKLALKKAMISIKDNTPKDLRSRVAEEISKYKYSEVKEKLGMNQGVYYRLRTKSPRVGDKFLKEVAVFLGVEV